MYLEELRFFNPEGPIEFSENRLPHWQQEGAVYFVTFRLADSLPEEKRSRWAADRENWRRYHPLPWTDQTEMEYHRLFSSSWDHWLDSGEGECQLENPVYSALVVKTLMHFEGKRTRILSCVVMPNHVHALFVLHPGCKLDEVVGSWKRHSAREINKMGGWTGGFWQKDYFDRLVRNAVHLVRCLGYIRSNPEKAGLGPGRYRLFESALALHMLSRSGL